MINLEQSAEWSQQVSFVCIQCFPRCQVLPQLLNHLGVDSLHGNSLDWGTLAVYTCKDSCEGATRYQREFVWKQDLTNETAAASATAEDTAD